MQGGISADTFRELVTGVNLVWTRRFVFLSLKAHKKTNAFVFSSYRGKKEVFVCGADLSMGRIMFIRKSSGAKNDSSQIKLQ